MLSSIIAVISVIGLSVFVTRKTNSEFWITPISVLCAIGLALFFGDFLGVSRLVAITLIVLGVYQFLRLIYERLVRTDRTFEITSLQISFVIFTIFLLAINKSSQFISWDEFSHWGSIIKVLYFKNTVIGANDLLYFRDYPPGMSYIAYFFMVLGDYSESAAIFSHAFLVLCAFFPLITALSKSSAVITYASSFVIFIFVAVYGQGWATVLIDQQIGALLVAAVGIMWVCRNSIERLFLLLPVLSFLVLTKAPGIQFAALFVIAVVIMDLSNYKNTQFPQLLRRGYLPVISGILVSYFAWKGFVALKGISPSVASASVFELLNKVRFCCETNRETLVVAEFSRRLFGSLNAPGSIITAAFFATLFIVPFIKDKAEKIRYLAVSLFLIAGSCLYLVMSLLYYLYSFSEQEALVLTSFERYFIPFIFVFFAQIIVGFSLVINQASGKYNASKIAFVSFVLVFVIFHFESYSKALRNYGSEFIGERVAIKSRVKEFVSNSHPHSSVLDRMAKRYSKF